MSLRVAEVGGLAVAFSLADERQVQAELTRLDPNLFLDKEIAANGPHGAFVYYVVKEWLGDAQAPYPVLAWRDGNGPKPLTMGIVEHVKRQEKRDERLLERIDSANAAREARIAADSEENYDDTVRDFDRAARNGGNFSGPVKRSRALYLSRARARSRKPK